MHANCSALVLMDDVCDPQNCALNQWAVGPTQAWAELKRLQLVRETGRFGACDRGWVSGHVQCRERPSSKPPHVIFASHSHPPTRTFLDELQDQTTAHWWTWPH